ncbi:MAG: hypothetical protein FJY92_09780, partial [Candidatus Hydrogenedentes bacterium]|nr:hypothetical protein [Candidatus Hydrogenedentota bacterium]
AFTLYINGSPAANGENLTELFVADIAALLRPGANTIAVAAENRGGKPNAAGVVCALSVQLDDGNVVGVVTDAQWQSAAEVGGAWANNPAAPGAWAPAHDLGPFGVAPWDDVGKVAVRIERYPDSAQVESVLHDLNVFPDFTSDAPLDYAHRRAGSLDIYFVSNGAPAPVDTDCAFRVTDVDAELWHPETGAQRALAHVSTTVDGRTAMSLRFDPAESYFIVFRPRDQKRSSKITTSNTAKDFPEFKTVATVPGPWRVAFDPKNGGPQQPVDFTELTDWSQHTGDGVRYYSGAAAYTASVDLSADLIAQRRPLYLDLGRVEVMASVRLNGKDLGIAWKRPFRIALGDAAKPGANALEVRVVNLWPNRMIGDEHLPPDSERNGGGVGDRWPDWVLEGGASPTGRYTFATWRHWTADDPLLPSGLLGPVTLLIEE